MTKPDYSPMFEWQYSLRSGPRVWLCALLIMVAGYDIRAGSPGLQVVGHLSATDTERAEFMIAIGNDVMCQVKDEAIYERQIAPLIGTDVVLTLIAK